MFFHEALLSFFVANLPWRAPLQCWCPPNFMALHGFESTGCSWDRQTTSISTKLAYIYIYTEYDFIRAHTCTLQYTCKCHTIPLHYFTCQKTHIITVHYLTLHCTTHIHIHRYYQYIYIDISTHVVYWCILITQFISHTLHMNRCLTLHIVFCRRSCSCTSGSGAAEKQVHQGAERN